MIVTLSFRIYSTTSTFCAASPPSVFIISVGEEGVPQEVGVLSPVYSLQEASYLNQDLSKLFTMKSSLCGVFVNNLSFCMMVCLCDDMFGIVPGTRWYPPLTSPC